MYLVSSLLLNHMDLYPGSSQWVILVNSQAETVFPQVPNTEAQCIQRACNCATEVMTASSVADVTSLLLAYAASMVPSAPVQRICDSGELWWLPWYLRSNIFHRQFKYCYPLSPLERLSHVVQNVLLPLWQCQTLLTIPSTRRTCACPSHVSSWWRCRLQSCSRYNERTLVLCPFHLSTEALSPVATALVSILAVSLVT